MIKIHKSSISGELKAPPSKSHAHRLVICYALSKTPKNIEYVGTDSYHSESVIKSIINCGNVPTDVECGQSASSFRFLLPIAGALGKNIRFFVGDTLTKRSIASMLHCFNSHGVKIEKKSYGYESKGQLQSGEYVIPSDVCAQYISGLMFALPLLKEDSKIITSCDVITEYTYFTIRCLEEFGIKIEKTDYGYFIKGNQEYVAPQNDIELEGDWLSSAALFAAAAMTGEITVTGLNMKPRQVDMVILELLRRYGASVTVEGDKVTVKKGICKPLCFDSKYTPGLVPIISILCANAKGKSIIKNVDSVSMQSPNRLDCLICLLTELGVKVACNGKDLVIEGGNMTGKSLKGMEDHRIIMAGVLAGLVCGNVVLDDVYAINKSYPDFISDLEKVKAITTSNLANI